MAKPPDKKTGDKKKQPERRKYTASASAVARSLVTPAMRAKGFAQIEVVTRWAHIVGPELAASTVPVSLRFPRGERMGATLVVRCESAFAPLLSHKAGRVIEMVNSFFGYAAVAKLEVKQGPLPARTHKALLEKKPLSAEASQNLHTLVGDGELSPLREAVKSLGEYVFSGTKKDQ
ncbi:DUF721 domain-containing protein [Kordiimonas aestuarii]|uniref:DUF721 domain-containing protein n=1 Tax=Kordiimonas aestuarii TaxID=1005925 RepID=UPI0021D325EF|nr:DciA family protein [Kordiimonas aestuarii]